MNFLLIGEQEKHIELLKGLLEITFPDALIKRCETEYFTHFLFHNWDLVIVLPVSRSINLNSCNHPILYIIDRDDSYDYLQLLQDGVRGIISIDAPLDVFRASVNFVKDGGLYFEPKIARNINSLISFYKPPITNTLVKPPRLTKRQLEIFRLVAQGFNTNEIAEKLAIKRGTVLSHQRDIKERTFSKTIPEAVAKGVRYGWLYDA